MKKGFVFGLILTLFVATGAIAGPAHLGGTHNLEGTTWYGKGRAISPPAPFNTNVDPHIYEDISICGTIDVQDGSLVYGTFAFDIPDEGPQSATVTGHVSFGGRIQAIMSLPELGEAPIGIGIIDANLIRNTIVGVARDFTDGSTTYFRVRRVEVCPLDGETTGD